MKRTVLFWNSQELHPLVDATKDTTEMSRELKVTLGILRHWPAASAPYQLQIV